MQVPRIRLAELGLVILVKLTLDYLYVSFVHPLYGYAGFTLNIEILRILESYLLLFLTYFSLPSKRQTVSATALRLIYLFSVIPLLSFYSLSGESRIYLYLAVSGFTFTILTTRILPRIRIPLVNIPVFYRVLPLAAITILVYGILIRLNGLPSLKALGLGSIVYEIRRVVDYGAGFMAYAVQWQGNVVNPFLLGWSIYRKNYAGIVFFIGLQVFLFLLTGHKSFLLGLPLVFFFVYSIRRGRLVSIGLAAILISIVLAYIVYAFGFSTIPASLLIRRAFFVPAKISFDYFGFFSSNPLTYLSQSHLAILTVARNPYSEYTSIANMMGLLYGGDIQQHMNTGFISEAYMNFGALGVFSFSLALGLILVLLDSLATSAHPALAAAAVGVPIMSLVNAALLTTLGTHGMLFGIFILWLYGKPLAKRGN